MAASQDAMLTGKKETVVNNNSGYTGQGTPVYRYKLYKDTETGKRYIIDMGYERNFTDGDTLIQTNDQAFSPPAGYRDMKNIHITNE